MDMDMDKEVDREGQTERQRERETDTEILYRDTGTQIERERERVIRTDRYNLISLSFSLSMCKSAGMHSNCMLQHFQLHTIHYYML